MVERVVGQDYLATLGREPTSKRCPQKDTQLTTVPECTDYIVVVASDKVVRNWQRCHTPAV